jgi:hypothetical protein
MGAIAVAIYVFVLGGGMALLGALLSLAALTDPKENRRPATIFASPINSILPRHAILGLLLEPLAEGDAAELGAEADLDDAQAVLAVDTAEEGDPLVGRLRILGLGAEGADGTAFSAMRPVAACRRWEKARVRTS